MVRFHRAIPTLDISLHLPLAVIPFGLVFSSFYQQENLPAYLGRGPLAFVVSHEILHSLDTSGRGFDSRGRLSDWWDDSSSLNYDKHRRCLQEQYQDSHRRYNTLPDFTKTFHNSFY